MVQQEKGFTLIEIIISLALMLGIFYLCIMQANALQVIKKQRYEGIAYQIANKQMEALRATSFASLPDSGTISDPLLAEIPSGAGTFTTSTYGSYSGMKEMVVTVTWNNNGVQSVILTTLAHAGGINP